MKTRKIQIQPFTPVFQPQIIDLILKIQQNEFNLPITADDQPDLSDIQGFYQKGKGNFWVALCRDQVVGTIALLDIGNQAGALRKMFVSREFRGPETSTARKLLTALIQDAAKNKLTEIYLGTTPKFLAAHRFYEKNDFLEISKQELPMAFPVMKVDTKFYKYQNP